MTAITCRGECGKTLEKPEDVMQAGWYYLAITRGWRCPDCDRELAAAGQMKGTEEDTTFVDPLPPDSRGALPKETASTITGPTVPLTRSYDGV